MGKVQLKDINDSIMDVSTKTRTVKAVWSRMNNIDLDNDIIVPEAFTKTLTERGPKAKNMIWSLVDHKADMNHVIGKPSELYIDGDKLVAVTQIVKTQAGEDLIKLYDAGLINQHSIGFSTIKQTEEKSGVRTISELKLYEGSAVLWGANPETPTLGFKNESRESLSLRLDNLLIAITKGNYSDSTYQLMESEIKRIQESLLTITQPAPAVEPKSTEETDIVKAIKQFNQLFKK